MEVVEGNASLVADAELLGLPQVSFEELTHLLSLNEMKRISEAIEILLGPILWSVCIIGMVLNIAVLVSCLFAKCSASTIMLGVISFCWIIKASALLFLHDVFQGKQLNIQSVLQDATHLDNYFA